jgi:hypothetical protein
MFDKVKYFYECMQAGKALQDPKLWNRRADLIAKLTVLFMAVTGLAEAFGYPLGLTGTDIAAVAQGVGVLAVTAVNALYTASNKEAGKR